MKHNLVTALFALGALGLVYLLFVPPPPPDKPPAARPLSTEAGPNGYLVARRWLEAEHVTVMALHDSYVQLLRDAGQPANGNVLLLTLPARVAVSSAESNALDQWLERGNTLILLAALDDTPAWSVRGGGRLVREVGRIARLDLEAVDEDDGEASAGAASSAVPAESTAALPAAVQRALGDRTVTLKPHGSHPLLDGVHTLRATSDLPSDRFRATPMDAAPVLELLDAMPAGVPAMWLRRFGRGQVVTVAFAGLFSNRDLPAADNGRLLSNLVAWHLAPGSRFIFDDARQGATRYLDAGAFYRDARLHHTLLWLVLLWLVFVLGIQRLRPARGDWRPVDVTGFLAVSGEFIASSAPPPAVGRRLLGNFFGQLQRRFAAPAGRAAAWDWLAAQAQLDARDLEALRRLDGRLARGQRVDLVVLQNLLSRIQGKFT